MRKGENKKEDRYRQPISIQQQRVLETLVKELTKANKIPEITPEGIELMVRLAITELWDRGFMLKEQRKRMDEIVNQLCKLISELP